MDWGALAVIAGLLLPNLASHCLVARRSQMSFHSDLPTLVRRLPNVVYEAMQLDGLLEVGLAIVSRENSLTKLIVHLPHVVRLPLGHPLKYIDIFLRDFQVFQGASLPD